MDQFESASWGGLLTVIGCSSSECHMSPGTDEVPVEMAIAAWNGRPTEDADKRDRWFPADDEQAALAECLAHVDDPRNAEQLAAELRKRGYRLFWTVVQG